MYRHCVQLHTITCQLNLNGTLLNMREGCFLMGYVGFLRLYTAQAVGCPWEVHTLKGATSLALWALKRWEGLVSGALCPTHSYKASRGEGESEKSSDEKNGK